jgi:hypothetical protein
MPIATKATRPMMLWNKCCMIVNAECQMVLDKVLTRYPDIKGVPILKFLLHSAQEGRRDVARGHWTITEHMFPYFICHFFWLDRRYFLSIHVTIL